MSRITMAFCACLILTFGQHALADIISVDPAGTYLHTYDDLADVPTVVDLSALTFPVHDGDMLMMQRVGSFSPNAAATPSEYAAGLAGMFSSSQTLLDYSYLNRVPDALATTDGTPVVTAPTFFYSQTTDIPQDFLIDSGGSTPADYLPASSPIEIQVPVGAHYLFLTVDDSYFSDNTDPNGDFALVVTPVPEPATLAIVALGICGLCFRRQKASNTATSFRAC